MGLIVGKKQPPTLLFYQGFLSPIGTTMGMLKLHCDTPTSVGPTQFQMASKTLENSSYTAKTTDSDNKGGEVPMTHPPFMIGKDDQPKETIYHRDSIAVE
jgi:hypothetical protein